MVNRNNSELEVTEEEFQEIISSSNQLIVVNFFAEWNMTCLMLTPMIDDLAEKMNEVKFVHVNIEDNNGISEKYNISILPCVVLFRDGKEIERIMRQQSIEAIEEKIRNCLNC